MVRIIFTRHGETKWNVEGRCQGQTDIELTEKGVSQGKTLARRLKNFNIDVILTSDLKRAYDTAYQVKRKFDKHNKEFHLKAVEIIKDPLLREYSFGLWEGLTTNDIKMKYCDLYEERNLDPNIDIPEAEKYSDLVKRCKEFVDKCVELYPDSTVLAVTHSGFIKALLHHYLELPWSVIKNQMYVGNCSLTVLKCGDKIVVETINDTAHFEGESEVRLVEARH
ncbi:histidine phosphatase family protein [Alkalicella caledoniensis]|uniref:Histidine phosphatase family protein n=1 Tax=Alkalicella caledoniensis TaxID=2731377 RepID=A0A7G9WBR9_ALKCA|nr:histidine phosphatase family protein [Alkalicella caledoniensis]QNO16131.1 histidine phosphatase family protein [Alkalicella caledoniensis]